MAVLKRLNINKFTSEADNDAFIEELKQMWLAWENPLTADNISVDINKDRNDPTRMTAFVSASGTEAINAMNEWSKNVVVPIRNQYKHENILIDADLIVSVSKQPNNDPSLDQANTGDPLYRSSVPADDIDQDTTLILSTKEVLNG